MRKKGDAKKALADCLEAIRLEPGSAGLHALRGAIHLELGEVGNVVASLEEAQRLDPKGLGMGLQPWPNTKRP